MKMIGVDLRPGVLVAAFFGSMVLAVLMREGNPWRVLTIVFVGLVSGVFFSPLIVPLISMPGVDMDAVQNAAGAVAGIAGMAIMNGIIGLVKKLVSH